MTPESAHPPVLAIASGPARTLARLAIVLIALGLAGSLVTLVGAGGVRRFGRAYLLGFTFLWVVVLGSLFLVALHHVTGAVWSVVVRRVSEMFAWPMVLVAVLFLPLLVGGVFFDVFSLYPWAHGSHGAHGQLAPSKELYLNPVFFTVRQVIYFGVWIFFARFFVQTSLRQDRGDGAAALTGRVRGASGPFLFLFAFTATFATFDWLMSLDPHWHSTILGVYVFAGMATTALAVLTLQVLWLRAAGALDRDLITADHLYNLGGLLFTFSCFWAYIAFSQFMLIWYANLPEEATFFLRRFAGPWRSLSILLAVLRFVLPFGLLLSRRAKVDARILVSVSVLIIVGEFLDLFWLIGPPPDTGAFVLGLGELGPTLCTTGALLLAVARFLRTHGAVAVGDPDLQASRNFQL